MPSPLFNLGRMLSTAEQHTEAQLALQRALTLNPSLSEAHQELGAVLFAQHRIPEALPHFFKATTRPGRIWLCSKGYPVDFARAILHAVLSFIQQSKIIDKVG
jgi:tetratricopeptide (TPR) repeat protein